MVRGIDKFREFFTGCKGNYVTIGGTVYEMHEEVYAQAPGATRDIDIILIVEALSSDFAAEFWEFVKATGYKQKGKGTGSGECRYEYHRFKEPGSPGFPYQIKLFSRNIGVIKSPGDAHITPISVDDDLSSLLATLMDDDCYNYTVEHSTLKEGVYIVNIESLIYLKCRAYLEMAGRKNNEGQMDSKYIVKHKKDIFRLIVTLASTDIYEVPDSLRQNVNRLRLAVEERVPNSGFFRSVGFKNISGEQLLEQLEANFIAQ